MYPDRNKINCQTTSSYKKKKKKKQAFKHGEEVKYFSLRSIILITSSLACLADNYDLRQSRARVCRSVSTA